MRPPTLDLTLAPLTVQQARWKAALLLAGCLAFVAGGAWMTTDQGAWGDGIFVVTVFGFGTVIAAIMLVRPASLILSSSGLSERGPWRTRRWDWREVSDFRVWTYRFNRQITFDSTKGKPGLMRSLNTAFGTGSDFLGGQWEVPPQDLADLLNEAKALWG